jgi:hypothetical protein
MDEPAARCPWCSAVLVDPAAATCPACGATLVAASTDAQIPGLTTISPDAVIRTKPVRRSRLLAWISGEVSDEVLAPRPQEGALAPPPDAVRLEILRLEREAALARGDVVLAAEAPPATEPRDGELADGEPADGQPTDATPDGAAGGEDATSPESS